MSSTNEYNDKSMNFRRLRRFLVDWLTGTEGSATYPWELYPDDAVAPEDGPLVFPPGLVWGAGGQRTLAWTWQEYSQPDGGLPAAGDGDPAFFFAARYKVYGAVTSGAALVFIHEFGRWPLVQCVERGGGTGGVPWLVYDPIANGGSILHDVGFDQVTVDFGGAFDGVVMMTG